MKNLSNPATNTLLVRVLFVSCGAKLNFCPVKYLQDNWDLSRIFEQQYHS